MAGTAAPSPQSDATPERDITTAKLSAWPAPAALPQIKEFPRYARTITTNYDEVRIQIS